MMPELLEANSKLLPYSERIQLELFLADQAWSLARVSGERAMTINSLGYGELFGALQGLFADRLTLSVTKLSDRSPQAYSIPRLLRKMRNLSSALEVRDPRRVSAWLSEQGRTNPLSSDREITNEVLRALEARLPSQADVNAKLMGSLRAAKTRRDKLIAHSEALSAQSLPVLTWGDLNALVRLAKEAISLVGWGYLATAYAAEIGHADHFLARDAERQAHALGRLLSAAGVADDESAP